MKSLRKLIVAAVVAVGGGSLHAQPAPSPTPTPAAPEPGATLPAEQRANVSAAEMRTRTQTSGEENREHLRHVEQLRLTARKQKDVIKLNCVNDKYLQIKALLNIVDAAQANLEVAILGNDDEARYHEYTKITISSEKIRAMRDEADACVGEELTYLGETEIVVNSPEIPDDPTQDTPWDDTIEPPAYAS